MSDEREKLRIHGDEIHWSLDLDTAWWIYEHLPSNDRLTEYLIDIIIKLEHHQKAEAERKASEPGIRIVVYETTRNAT